jgi:hypothetical protein
LWTLDVDGDIAILPTPLRYVSPKVHKLQEGIFISGAYHRVDVIHSGIGLHYILLQFGTFPGVQTSQKLGVGRGFAKGIREGIPSVELVLLAPQIFATVRSKEFDKGIHAFLR